MTTVEAHYDAIATKYDWFYSSWDAAGEAQCRQIEPLFRGHSVRRVLDCACGNGLQAIALARAGFEITGSDLSARMIEEAEKKCREEDVEIPLIHADMRALRDVAPGPFDAVVCMGNVLPHLPDEDAVRVALGNVRDVLVPGGLLVLEGRYYDDLVREKPRFIPHRVSACTEDTQSVTILYVLDYFEAFIRFNIVFLVKGRGGDVSMDVDAIDYHPILSDQLHRLLREEAFTILDWQRHEDRYVCVAQRTTSQS